MGSVCYPKRTKAYAVHSAEPNPSQNVLRWAGGARSGEEEVRSSCQARGDVFHGTETVNSGFFVSHLFIATPFFVVCLLCMACLFLYRWAESFPHTPWGELMVTYT